MVFLVEEEMLNIYVNPVTPTPSFHVWLLPFFLTLHKWKIYLQFETLFCFWYSPLPAAGDVNARSAASVITHTHTHRTHTQTSAASSSLRRIFPTPWSSVLVWCWWCEDATTPTLLLDSYTADYYSVGCGLQGFRSFGLMLRRKLEVKLE